MIHSIICFATSDPLDPRHHGRAWNTLEDARANCPVGHAVYALGLDGWTRQQDYFGPVWPVGGQLTFDFGGA